MRGFACVFVGLAIALSVPSESLAQVEANESLTNLFFDCQAPNCRDLDFFRREVPFVNWVRDRETSDVHVLVTSERTGGGGLMYSMAFIGVGDFAGVDGDWSLSTAGDATNDETRSGVADRLKLGLIPYLQGTSTLDRLTVQYQLPDAGVPGGAGATQSQDDPWDFWTFRLNGNGFVNGEATARFSNYSGSLQADRTTEAWKINLRSNYSQNVQEFDLPDENGDFRTVRETREDWGLDGTLVRSVGDQWALGVRSEVGSSTFFNQDFRWNLMPGVEYNFVPYSESSRRSITLQYLAGPTHFDYSETTIFGQTHETRLQQSLTGRISLVQPWGRWSTSVTGAQFVHDLSKYNVSVSGNVNVRLFRGFSVRVDGNYSWIRDQLHIAAGALTDEQVLLRQRQLETSYRYFTSFGIEYRFGSIFNNVVNPRFGRGGGGGRFFF